MSRVPEDYRSWLKFHNRDDETTFETLDRLVHSPDPAALTGILTAADVREARTAAQRFDGRETERWERARHQFEK